ARNECAGVADDDDDLGAVVLGDPFGDVTGRGILGEYAGRRTNRSPRVPPSHAAKKLMEANAAGKNRIRGPAECRVIIIRGEVNAAAREKRMAGGIERFVVVTHAPRRRQNVADPRRSASRNAGDIDWGLRQVTPAHITEAPADGIVDHTT